VNFYHYLVLFIVLVSCVSWQGKEVLTEVEWLYTWVFVGLLCVAGEIRRASEYGKVV